MKISDNADTFSGPFTFFSTGQEEERIPKVEPEQKKLSKETMMGLFATKIASFDRRRRMGWAIFLSVESRGVENH